MTTVTVKLPPEAVAALRLSVAHHAKLGGLQNALIHCQQKLQGDGTLTLERLWAERVVHYASGKSGVGGMQNRLKTFSPLVEAELDKLPPAPVTGTLDL